MIEEISLCWNERQIRWLTYWTDCWMNCCRWRMAGCIPVWIQWSLLGRFRTLGTGSLGWSVGWWSIRQGFCTLVVGSSLHQLSSDSTRWADCSWDIWRHSLVLFKFWNYSKDFLIHLSIKHCKHTIFSVYNIWQNMISTSERGFDLAHF